MRIVKVGRCKLGRPVAGELKPIITKDQIDIGYGPGQLLPDGSRQPLAEANVIADITMDINGMSGQRTG